MSYPVEEWRAVPGYEDLYEVSSFGRIKSLQRTVTRGNGRPYTVKERILKGSPSNGMKFSLHDSGEAVAVNAARLVYSVFVADPDPHLLVLHRNGDGNDCGVENLFLGTQEVAEDMKIARSAETCATRERGIQDIEWRTDGEGNRVWRGAA